MLWLILVGVIILFLIFGIIFWTVKHALWLALNSVLGFFALYAVQAWLMPDLLINVWSVLLVSVFGIFGLILVVALSLFGLAFQAPPPLPPPV